LTDFLQKKLGAGPLTNFVSGGDYSERVNSVLRIAQSGGWTRDLISAMQVEQPDNPLMRNLPIALRLAEKTSPPRPPAGGMDLEKIVRNGGFKDLRLWAEKMTAIGQAVCRIEYSANGTFGYGTGLLVADDLVLTNYHVIENHLPPGLLDPTTIRCRFDYARDVKGLSEGRVVSLAPGPSWIVEHSAYDDADLTGVGTPAADHLDFALLRLAEAAGRHDVGAGARRGTIALRTPKVLPSESEPVFIAQHPLGKPLALGIGVVQHAVTNLRLRYDADTEGGSSGSGVFNQALELVALHHAGDPRSKIRAEYNQGIPIDLIVTMLKGRGVLLGIVVDALQKAIGTQPAVLIFSADDKCDGEPHPIVDRLERLLRVWKKEVVRFASWRLRISPEHRRNWEIAFRKVPRNADVDSYRELLIFADAFHVEGTRPIDIIHKLCNRDASLRKKLGMRASSSVAVHRLYDTARRLLEWRNCVLFFSREHHLQPKLDYLRLCVAAIREEQTWDWLYLLKIAHATDQIMIKGIWELHDMLSTGLYRHTSALSNIVSLLCYLGAYSHRDGLHYLHCNLRGVLMSSSVTKAKFEATDLTGAVLQVDAARDRLVDTTFVSCLFDEETLRWLTENGCKLLGCYVERSDRKGKTIERIDDYILAGRLVPRLKSEQARL
jgi:Trypsin-like peptidase domain